MLLALLSFSLLGVCHKVADVKQCRPSTINALLYLSSFMLVFGLVTVVNRSSPATPAGVVSIAIPFGISASIAILAFQAGIRHGSIATSWLVINLSSAIPTVASILIYRETVTPAKALAMMLIPAAMVLLWIDKKHAGRRRS